MDPIDIIKDYYRPGTTAYEILVRHGEQVAEKAIAAAGRVAHLDPDLAFLREAAMLHDIGMFLTNSPGIGCFGIHPYVMHGVLGHELLEDRGMPRHGRVCERHVGVGISAGDVRLQGLPLPERDMLPETLEEKIICFADKFFSKNGGQNSEKSLAQIRKSLGSYGDGKVTRFESWLETFG